jgi:hypothetical protein
MEPPTRVQRYSLPHIRFWKLESSLLVLYSCAGSMNMHDLDKQAIIWKWKYRKRCNVYDCLLKYLRDKNLKHHKLKILLTCLTSQNNFENIIKPPTPKSHHFDFFQCIFLSCFKFQSWKKVFVIALESVLVDLIFMDD